MIHVSKGKASTVSRSGTAAAKLHTKSLRQRIMENWQMYALLLIPVVLTIVYKYIPMYGIQIAFRDFSPARDSPEVLGWA